ncbi:MAG TPA: xanthine dehydrogenase family protein molybdopterin-binding subunit [Alphaproteobacteria bacterium]
MTDHLHGAKVYPTPPTTEERKILGHRAVRLEDPPLVTGRGRYAGDINFPRQMHMRIVRSAQAHGKIVSINTAAALAVPGVVAIWTNDDIKELGPVDFRADRAAEILKPYRQPVLAKGRVRYVGDPIAAVFAEDPYVAEDAAELVEVEIEELPVVIDCWAPTGEFEPGRTTEGALLKHSFGDIEGAFKKAHTIVELDLFTGRHSGVPMETRGAIGFYDKTKDILELHGAAKVPHRNRDTLVNMLGRAPKGMHVHESHVGGGFGIRGELYPEDVLVLVAAMRFDRPVKWIEDRREHLMCANQGREQRHKVRICADENGKILGIDDEIFHDQGAYVRTHGANVANRTLCMMTGGYDIPAYRGICHYRLTNKTPCATYRAPGRYESTFVRERLVDALADKMGLDRIEIRRRNLIHKDQMPYLIEFEEQGVEELLYDSGDYALLLDKSLAAFKWDETDAALKARRAKGEMVGIGIALFVEESGRGPSDGAKISVDVNGDVELVTGGASLGQGFETSMAQIAAEALGVDYQRITVIHGQTDRIAQGIGAHAARATVLTGSAVNETALKLRAKALEFGAELLQLPVADLDIVDGVIVKKGSPPGGPSLSLGDLAKKMAPGAKLLNGRDPHLFAEAWFNTDFTVFPYGVHLAQVRVDKETGQTKVERFLIGYDIGRAVNPMMVEGQLVGGCVQGIGGALFEEFAYSETGEPLAVTFVDYLLPTLGEVPKIDVLITEDAPSPMNPLGIKGAGEGGINGVGGAIASAIDDAIGKPGAVVQLPVSPQRMKALLA